MTGSIYDWAVSPDSNQTADAAINWQEFQDPPTVNNSAGQMMARVSEWLEDIAPTVARLDRIVDEPRDCFDES